MPAAATSDQEKVRRRLSSRQLTLLAIGAVLVVYGVMMRGLLRTQGPPMEEGFMLVFPERLLHGDLPNKDFLHLYGPGSIWALAGWFQVFGVNLVSERIFGLLQQLAIVLGMFTLARSWGRTVALPCALLSLMFIVPPLNGLIPLAWVGAIGLGLLGLACLLTGRRRLGGTRGTAMRWAIGGGLLLGVAVLFRLDLAVATLLGGLAAVWGTSRAFKLRALAGYAVAAVGYLVHIALVGFGPAFQGMVLDPVFKLRGGRKLPIPPPANHLDGFLERSRATVRPKWPIPSANTPQQLNFWFWALVACFVFLVVVAIWDLRRHPDRFRARVLFVIAMFSIGIGPQAVQRVDSAHFGWVSCVVVAAIPLAVLELLQDRWTSMSVRQRNSFAGVGTLVVVLLTIPYFTGWPLVDYTLQTFGEHRVALPITRNGRVYYYGRADVQAAASELLRDIPKVAPPGSRLFIGTEDLRKTPYSDAWLSFLLPDYPPATYYIEMDPGMANAKGSGLADDLKSADIPILSTVWNDWDEPNDSRLFGSDAANKVLRRDFCLVKDYGGLYLLYKKCHTG
jgi:hypothetical protein